MIQNIKNVLQVVNEVDLRPVWTRLATYCKKEEVRIMLEGSLDQVCKEMSDVPSTITNHHAIPVVSIHNLNLSEAEKELLRWHQRLGHLAFKKVQYLMRTGVLATSELTKHLHHIACKAGPIKCAACACCVQSNEERCASSPYQ